MQSVSQYDTIRYEKRRGEKRRERIERIERRTATSGTRSLVRWAASVLVLVLVLVLVVADVGRGSSFAHLIAQQQVEWAVGFQSPQPLHIHPYIYTHTHIHTYTHTHIQHIQHIQHIRSGLITLVFVRLLLYKQRSREATDGNPFSDPRTFSHPLLCPGQYTPGLWLCGLLAHPPPPPPPHTDAEAAQTITLM
jgi:hypothetical protein